MSNVRIYRTYDQDYERYWLVSDKVMIDLSEIVCYVETTDDDSRMPVVKMFQSRNSPGVPYVEIDASLAEIINAFEDAGVLDFFPGKTKKAEE